VKPFIAIVDDDASVCRALKRLIRSLGMEAETFASGQEFIGRLEGTPALHVDCIVLDLHMPNMNGLEVQDQLVKSGSRHPIVFITAYDDSGARAQALAAGAVAFLRKPFTDELLLGTLRQALEQGFPAGEIG
jgi:FixJ family two-component response regulator